MTTETGNMERYSGLHSPVHRLNPKSKIVVLIAFIVLCSMIGSFSPVLYGAYLAFLTAVFIFSGIPLLYIIKRLSVILFLVIIVAGFTPFIKHLPGENALAVISGSIKLYRTGLMVFLNILVRVCLSVSALLILILTAPFTELMEGFAELKVPALIVNIINLTYRYLSVITDEALRMKRAAVSRGYSGKWLWHAGAVGRITGSLFLRSYERSERVYYAMLSRGYTGKMFSKKTQPLCKTDWFFIGISLFYIAGIRLAV